MKMHVTSLKSLLLLGIGLQLCALPSQATGSDKTRQIVASSISGKLDIQLGTRIVESDIITLNDENKTPMIAIDVQHLGFKTDSERQTFERESGFVFKGSSVLIRYRDGYAQELAELTARRDAIIDSARSDHATPGPGHRTGASVNFHSHRSDDVFRNEKPDFNQIRQDVFDECVGMGANDKVECYAEQMSVYQDEMYNAGATESQIRSKMKSAFSKFRGRLKSMLNSKDESVRDQGYSALMALRSAGGLEGLSDRELDRLERKYVKDDRKFKRLARIEELKNEYRDECSDAEHPAQVHRALSDLAHSTSRRMFHEVGSKSGCLSKAGFNTGMLQTPFGMPGMQCMGDFCLPGQGMNNMFTQGRCNNMGYGSSMIGAFPGMGMPGMSGMRPPMPGMGMGMPPRPMPGMPPQMSRMPMPGAPMTPGLPGMGMGMPHMAMGGPGGMAGGMMGCGFNRMGGFSSLGIRGLNGIGNPFMRPTYGGPMQFASTFRGHPHAGFYGQSMYGTSMVRSPMHNHRAMPFGPNTSVANRHAMGWPSPPIGGGNIFNNLGVRSTF